MAHSGLSGLVIDAIEPASLGTLTTRGAGERRSNGSMALVTATEHPEAGLPEFDCHVLHIPDSDQRLVVYSPEPGSATAAAFRRLAAGISPAGISPAGINAGGGGFTRYG